MTDVEEFTGVGDFMQLHVRTYSAGMATQLMFAVATSTKPDIILVDEMFGTDDAEFQIKAKARMLGLIRSDGIFVFSSHSLDIVKQYCNRFFYVEHGVVREIEDDELASDRD
jgi:ABC-type polysaccharide/polyol phosphate transport system ATPase subunit